MFITEYDEARTFAEQKAEGRAEGIAEGRAEGREEGKAEGIAIGEARGEAKGKLDAFIGLVRDGILTISQAAEKNNMSVPEFEAAMQTM